MIVSYNHKILSSVAPTVLPLIYISNVGATALKTLDYTTNILGANIPSQSITNGITRYGSILYGVTSNAIKVINSSTGALISSYTYGSVLRDIEADANNMYIADSSLGRFSALNKSTGAIIWQSPVSEFGGAAGGQACKLFGGSLYCLYANGTLAIKDITNGNNISTITLGMSGMQGLEIIGSNIYVSQGSLDRVIKYDMLGNNLGYIQLPSGYGPRHIVEAGGKLYIASSGSSNLRYIDILGFTLNTNIIALGQSFNKGITI